MAHSSTGPASVCFNAESTHLLSRKGYLEVNQSYKDLLVCSSLLTWDRKQACMHTYELLFRFYTANLKLQPICYKWNLSIHNPLNPRIGDRWIIIMGDRMLTKLHIAFLCPCHISEWSVPILTGAVYHVVDKGSQNPESIQRKCSHGLKESSKLS